MQKRKSLTISLLKEIKLTLMNGKYLLDTNIIVDLLKGDQVLAKKSMTPIASVSP
jgi:hypothetical protein